MKTIIVTGAGGFIGTAVLQAFAARGDNTISVFNSPPKANPAGGSCIVLDLRKHSSWQVLERYRPTDVLHLASRVPSSFSGEASERAAEDNRLMDDLAINFCQQTGAHLIYASGTSLYGCGRLRLCRESDPLSPVGPYLGEKVVTEELMKAALAPNKHCSLRISAPYGIGQQARNVIRIFIERALANAPLLFHGTGERTQDFTYIDDIADAFVRAVSCNASGAFNIASGQPVSMKGLAHLITEIIPSCSSIVTPSGVEDPQEEFRASYDLTLAYEQLSWTPRTSLREGLARLINSLKDTTC